MLPEDSQVKTEQEPETKKGKKKPKKKVSDKNKETEDLEAQFGPGSKGLDG